MKKYLVISVYILSIANLFAQELSQLDSMTRLIKSSGEDSVRVKAFIYVTKIYYKASNFDSALVNVDRAIALSQKINSDNYFEQQHLGNAYRAKARIYQKFKSDYRLALKYYKDYYEISEKIKDKVSMADAFHGIANMYLYLSNYDKALTYYIQSAKLNEETGNELWMANDYTNMAIVYMRQKAYSKATDILKQAVVPYAKANDKDGLVSAYKNLGVCYSETGNYDDALTYYNKCVEIEKEKPDEGLAGTYNNIGIVLMNQKKSKEALDYFNQSYEILQIHPDSFGLAYCFQGFGTVYSSMNQHVLAQEYLLKATAVSKSMGMTYELMDNYGLLAENYANLKDYVNAYKYRGLQSELKDTIHNSDSRNAFAEMQTKFETDAKEKEIELLKNEQDINNLALEKQRVFIISAIVGILSLLVITLLIYNRNRIKQRLNQELEKLSLVARSTDNIVIIMDANGKIEWANESFERLNGISIDALKLKKGETIFEVSNNPRIREYVNKAIADKKSVVYESKNSNLTGELIWEQSMLTPVFNEKNELQRLIIVDTNITQRKHDEQIIQEKNKDIIDSINYAKRIQDAILPSIENRTTIFPESFILFKPRDIVSGDFYWYAEKDGKKIIAAVDCTGHGVPGALMSMIGNAFLNEIVNKRGITTPGLILSELRHLVISTLKQSSNQGENKDGMDIALVAFDTQTKSLEFAGANNPLWIFTTDKDEKKLVQIKGDKRPIGYFQGRGLPFTNHSVEYKPGDVAYLFTDGFADQFGGDAGKKFKYKKMQETILGIQNETFSSQKEILDRIFEQWKGPLEQVDDMLVIGVKFL